MGLLPQLLKIEVSPSIQRSGTNTTIYSAYSTLYLGLKFLTSKCDSSLSLWKFPLGVYFFILQINTLQQTVRQDSHHPLLHPPRMLGPETQELHFSYPPAIRGLDKADSLPVRWTHGRSKREGRKEKYSLAQSPTWWLTVRFGNCFSPTGNPIPCSPTSRQPRGFLLELCRVFLHLGVAAIVSWILVHSLQHKEQPPPQKSSDTLLLPTIW